MKDRIYHIVASEGLTNQQFAAIIDISPAAISHILAGRNNPGIDVVISIARKFPHYNLRWLLLGEGPTLGDDEIVPQNTERVLSEKSKGEVKPTTMHSSVSGMGADLFTSRQETANDSEKPENRSVLKSDNSSSKLIICYPDGTYSEYTKRH